MQRKQKITFETVKHFSTNNIEQRLGSYIDYMHKNNYILLNLPYRIYIKVEILKREYYNRLDKMKIKNANIIKQCIYSLLYTYDGKNLFKNRG